MYLQQRATALHGTGFVAKVDTVAQRLKINPSWLMRVMESESRLNPAARNPGKNQTATGLIQFVESTARALGTTTSQLAAMSAERQMDFVYKYYRPWAGKLHSFADLYLVTFYPLAMQKPAGFVLGSERSPQRIKEIAKANAGVDLDRSGSITKFEFLAVINDKAPAAVEAKKNPYGRSVAMGGLSLLLLFAAGAWYAKTQNLT
jgi:hypothetical protein